MRSGGWVPEASAPAVVVCLPTPQFSWSAALIQPPLLQLLELLYLIVVRTQEQTTGPRMLGRSGSFQAGMGNGTDLPLIANLT